MFKKLLKSKKCYIFVVLILALIGICLLVNSKMIQSKENFTDSGSDVSGRRGGHGRGGAAQGGREPSDDKTPGGGGLDDGGLGGGGFGGGGLGDGGRGLGGAELGDGGRELGGGGLGAAPRPAPAREPSPRSPVPSPRVAHALGNTSNGLIDYSGLSSPVGKLNSPTLLTPQPLVCSNCSDKTFWSFSSKDRNPVTVDFNDVSANDINGCRDYCNKNQSCEGWLMNPSDGKCHIYPTLGTSGNLTRSCESVSGRSWFGEVNPVVKDRLRIIDVEPCMIPN